MVIKVFLTLLIAFSAVQVRAGSLADSYRSETSQLIQSLQQSGVKKVACRITHCLSLSHLQEVLDQVQIVEVPGFAKPDVSTREMAFNSPTENTIFLNTLVDHPTEMRAFLGLHELLGIAGVAETEYQLTLMAVALSKMKSGQWVAQNNGVDFDTVLGNLNGGFAFQGDYTNTAISLANTVLTLSGGRPTGGGGVTLVGGAGDGNSLLQRIKYYEYLRNSQSCMAGSVSIALIFHYDVPIEVVESDAASVTYVSAGKDAFWPRHILVPRHLTLEPPTKDPTAPNKAIEDIAFYLSSVHWQRPLFCQHKFEWQLMKSKDGLRPPYFWYPVDVSTIHPQIYGNFLKPIYDRRCQNNTCEVAGSWDLALAQGMYGMRP